MVFAMLRGRTAVRSKSIALVAATVVLVTARAAHAECDAGPEAGANADAGGCVGGCASDTDCTASEFCEGATGTCTTKLADGTALPAGDTCDTITADRECASMMCDPASNACGAPKQPSLDAGFTTSQPDAAAPASTSNAAPQGPTYIAAGGGCSCRTSAADSTSLAPVVAFALGTLLIARRRRR